MTHRLLLGVIVAAAIGILAVSLVPGWVVHVRHQGGHGLTEIGTVWNAWQGRAWPHLPTGVVAAALTGALAGAELLTGRRMPRALLVAGSILALALFAAATVPLERTGYASRVVITAAWPLAAGIGLGLGMATCAAMVAGLGRRQVGMVAMAGVVLVAAGFGGRVAALNLAEGDPRSFRPGTYLRAAGGGTVDTLVIGDDTYRVEGRWSGTFEGRGLVVVLTDDPACPDARGSYRIFPAGEDAIRWNLIVDLCAGGARAADLTTGTWEPGS